MADRHPWKKRAGQMALGSGAVRGTAQGELLPSEGQLGEADFFPTPDWCIEGLLQVCPPPRFTCGDAIHGRDMVVLEPAAGSGAIVRLLLAADYQVRALEIRPRALPELRKLCPAEWGCWLRFSEPGRGYPELVKLCGCELNRVAICTNPPYAIARDFVMQALLTPSPWVAMLLRVDVSSGAAGVLAVTISHQAAGFAPCAPPLLSVTSGRWRRPADLPAGGC